MAAFKKDAKDPGPSGSGKTPKSGRAPKPAGPPPPKGKVRAKVDRKVPPAARAKGGATRHEPKLVPPPGGVTVRMYRQGLGDCFLLAFAARGKGRPTYVLIDCGVHMRQEKGTARLSQVMEDLKEATGGMIDVVVATHEHADHLSGFVQKGSPFVSGEIEAGQFWVAWTERADGGQADELRSRRGAAREAIRRAADRLAKVDGAAGAAPDSRAARLLGLMDFETLPAEALAAAPGRVAGRDKEKRPSSNEVALEFLSRHSDKVVYCDPGQVKPLPRVAARAYVLGPPRLTDLLKRDLPRKGTSQETYLASRNDHQTFMLAPALDDATSAVGGKIPEDLRYPFDRNVGHAYAPDPATGEIRWAAPGLVPGPTQVVFSSYANPSDGWRTIEADWLTAAEDLALNLDNDTNNTSLVLAFEVGTAGQGHVLLFVGDAQVGNWLSWRRQEYEVDRVRQTADVLLGRTILYKVGHHGSHNATVKIDPEESDPAHPNGVPFGLELMPPHLIALVPVNRAAAQRPMPKPWEMPHPRLYKRLLERTSGRVLRSDGQSPEPDLDVGGRAAVGPRGPKRQPVPGVPGCHWCEAEEEFADGPKHPLFYDVELRG